MSSLYKPLAPNEFRVLKLLPSDKDADDIRCELEHVPLPPLANNAFPPHHKGHDRIWPELQSAHDVNAIFNSKVDTKSHTTALDSIKLNPWTPTTDEPLPWRFKWGDYLALSYVWGLQTPQPTILLNGTSFSIGPGLYEVLSKLRRSARIKQGFRLWVDALCINQSDSVERGEQVRAMRQIYSSAWQVVMSLGAAGDDSDLAMAAVRWMGSQHRAGANALETFSRQTKDVLIFTVDVTPDLLKKSTLVAVEKLFIRPYFRRMWVLQEIAMAREDCPVICGDVCVSWGELCDAAGFIGGTQGKFEEMVKKATGRKEEAYLDLMQIRIDDGKWSEERTWKLFLKQMVLQRGERERERGSGIIDLLLPLRLARLANVTHDVDRVYGILGIKAIYERVTMIPDYGLDLGVVYRQFMTELLSSGDLTALRLLERFAGTIYETSSDSFGLTWDGKSVMAGLKDSALSRLGMRKKHEIGDKCRHIFSTWVVCWACKGPSVAPLRGLYDAGTKGGLKNTPKFESYTEGVQLQGFVIDDIVSLSSFHHAETDATYPFTGDWPENIQSIYGDIEATREALWRTLVGNTTAQGGEDAPDDQGWLLDEQIWFAASSDMAGLKLFLGEFLARNKSLMLGQHSFGDLIRPHLKDQPFVRAGPGAKLTPEKREAVIWLASVLAWRRIVGTANGRIGLVPAAAKADDCIAVLAGCSVPVVMRREQMEQWSIVGECYIHGVMKGEALQGRETLSSFDVI